MDKLHDRGITLQDIDYKNKMFIRTFANDTLIFNPHSEPVRIPVEEFKKVLEVLTNKEDRR